MSIEVIEVGIQGPPGVNGSSDTAAQILAKLVTVDGSGSDLNADKLDDHDSTYFATDADLDNHLTVADAHDGTAITYTGIMPVADVQAAIDYLTTLTADHLDNEVDAHDSSAISYPDPISTTVELKLTELSLAVAALPETVQDIVGALIAAGTGITIVYNDAGNVETISIASGAITSTLIADDTIVDADVNSAASIKESKLARGRLVTKARNHVDASGAAPVWGVANRAAFTRIVSSPDTNSFSSVRIYVQISNGNISIGVYTNSGAGENALPSGGRTVTTGSIACPGVGYATVSLGATVTPVLGDWFGFSSSSATAAFKGNNAPAGGMSDGLAGYQETAHPIPDPPVFVGGTSQGAPNIRAV